MMQRCRTVFQSWVFFSRFKSFNLFVVFFLVFFFNSWFSSLRDVDKLGKEILDQCDMEGKEKKKKKKETGLVKTRRTW